MKTELKTQIDSSTFEETAKVVWTINKTIREAYPTWQCFESYMYSMAYRYIYGEKSGFFSTAGFCLTGFDANGSRHCVATVMTYSVKCYIDEIKKLVE